MTHRHEKFLSPVPKIVACAMMTLKKDSIALTLMERW